MFALFIKTLSLLGNSITFDLDDVMGFQSINQNHFFHQFITATDASFGDDFGVAVDISNNTAIISANRKQANNGVRPGFVYIFEFENGQWVEVDAVTATSNEGWELFGSSINIEGDVFVVGAPANDANGFEAGAAFIFEKIAGNWVQTHRLEPTDALNNDLFGTSVRISNDIIVVGSPGRGSAFVFERDVDNTWVQVQQLIPQIQNSGSEYGHAVAIDEDTIAIGAYRDDSNRGAVHLFERVNNNWVFDQKINASDGVSFDEFGYSLAMENDVLLVGAYKQSELANDSGAVYYFRKENNTWVEKQKIRTALLDVDGYFGFSIDLDDHKAMIGTVNENTPQGQGTGSAYLFHLINNQWVEKHRYFESDGVINDRFGESVAIENNISLVGIPKKEIQSTEVGAAYILDNDLIFYDQF